MISGCENTACRLKEIWAFTLLALLSLLAGCASPPGLVFDAGDGTHIWPPPPDTPRIRYIGQLRGESDLRRGKSGMERLGETLFGSAPTQTFVSPMGVCTDGAQHVYIADSEAQAVHVLNLETRAYSRIAPTARNERLSLPVAIAYDPSGRLLVSDAIDQRIVVFDMSGKRLGTLGEGLLQRPCGVAVDPSTHRVFIADTAAHQILVLSESGTELARIGRRGSQPGEFNFPTNIAFDSAGRLYVSDSLNFRVQIFGKDFEPIRQFGRKGDMPGYFSQPKGIAVDPEGHIYVVDANFEAVQVFDSSGTLLMTFGQEGEGPGEFWLPNGIYADATGRIWVADSYNRRVQVFQFISEEAKP